MTVIVDHMTLLPDLIDRLAANPGPALTYYGVSRMELGGPVVARWMAKIANLLEDNLSPALMGGEDTGSIVIDLGSTWQGVLWRISASLMGWRVCDPRQAAQALPQAQLSPVAPTVQLPTVKSAAPTQPTPRQFVSEPPAPPQSVLQEPATSQSVSEPPTPPLPALQADVYVTNDAAAAEIYVTQGLATHILMHNLSPMAFTWDGALPAWTVDALGELMAQADGLVVDTPYDPTPLELASRRYRVPTCERLATHTRTPEQDAELTVACWTVGSSLVLIDPLRHPQAHQHAEIARVEGATLLSDFM